MRTVDGVARLKADDPLPAALSERGARFCRVGRKLGEARRRPLEDRDLAGCIERLLLVEAGDSGMRVVRRSECLARLAFLVVVEDALDLENGVGRPGFVRQRDPVP